MIDIPIRYYRDYAGAYDYGYETLGLPLDECALLGLCLADDDAAAHLGTE